MRSLLACAAAFALCLAPLSPVLHAADEGDIITIKSFEDHEGFVYAYGSWEGQIQTMAEGVLIAGSATATGGAGGELLVDVSRAKNIFITLRTLPENRAQTLNVILMDRSGHGAGFVLNLAKVGTEWTTLQLDMARQSFRPPDMQPNPDWSAIAGFQIQGNHSGDAAVAVQIRSICAAPPPSPVQP
ncbi:MAG: hypothetical protein MUE42_06715 [Opitutaceae bacterium]|jgi:hypothetical protein|nr:hypothetical protein [Opitutaceae bacterium]